MTIFQTQKTTHFAWLDNCFESIFNLAYKTLVIPYGIEYDEQQGTYSASSKSWRKGLTSCLNLVAAVFSFIAVNATLGRATLRSPAIIFTVAPDVGDLFLCFSFWYVVWFRKHDVSALFTAMTLESFGNWNINQRISTISVNDEYLEEKSISRQPIINKRKGNGGATICTLICFVVTFLIITFEVIRYYGYLSGRAWRIYLFDEIRRGSFLDERSVATDLNTIENVVTYVHLSFIVYLKITKSFAILLCLAAVACVFKNSYQMKIFMEKERDQLRVIQAFQSFREFLEAVNQMTGPMIFVIAIVCAPTFFVANFAKVLISWSYDSPITWLTIFIYSSIIMLAAEVTNENDEFREWILECGEGEYEQLLFGVFVDLTQNPVGIRGMECFTVTYSFLAQMMSAVVTFTIILLQFQSE